MKILTILGARPQFIKAGSVSREIAKRKNIDEVIIHTGQHYDSNMSDIFFNEMHIPKPNYFLGVGGKSHGAMTGQMIEKIEEVALKENPDWIMVYGDTNSTLAGAIVASKLHIKLAHIEAGLRSFNMKMPEEINRILTDRISNILFCPTDTAIENLKKEGFENFNCKIVKSGDVMQDGAMYYSNISVKPNIKLADQFILTTIHRAENTDDIERLKSIIDALNEINQDIQVILPLHPRTKKIIDENNIVIDFRTIEPVGYLEMVYLIQNSNMIITDSGGLQKEAFFFSKPCITMRDETEWIELVEHKFNILVGADKENILEAFKNYTFNDDFSIDLYGNGTASNKIVMELLNW
jgi:UDP-GlcNAc3NAcA epimerase